MPGEEHRDIARQMTGLELLQDLVAARAWHLEGQKDGVGILELSQRNALVAAVSSQHLEVVLPQDGAHALDLLRLVVDDEDRVHSVDSGTAYTRPIPRASSAETSVPS